MPGRELAVGTFLRNFAKMTAFGRHLGLAAMLATWCACDGGGNVAAGGAGGSSTVSGSNSASTGAGGAGAGSSSSGSGMPATCSQCTTLATLAPGSMPHGLFVDATNVYWTNLGSGEVQQAKLDGSDPVTLTVGEIAPVAVQVLDGFVYWASYSEAGKVRKAPVGGGNVVDLATAPAVRELYVSADFMWWTRDPDDLHRAPTAGLPMGVEPDLLSANPLPNGLAGDALNLYWVNRLEGGVKKAAHDFSNEVALAKGDVPWDIVVDETSIYWTEQGSMPGAGKVMKASKTDGAGVTMLAADAAGPQGIAVDATRVYWANKNDGTIKSVPITGGAVTVLAAAQVAPANVAVDAHFVYWTDAGGDAIMRAPKN